MSDFEPSFGIKETSKNIKGFVKSNKSEFWKIFKPLMPFIIGLHLMDSVVTSLYMPDSKNGFMLGSILSAYFMVALTISWHRVVIHGVDNYVPMNPFKPKKHELMFIVMGFFFVLAVTIASLVFGVIFMIISALIGLSKVIASIISGVVIAVIVILAIWIFYRVVFYFPAKAVNANITLKQAFYLSKGLLGKLVASSLLASIKLILLMYGFLIIAIIAMFPIFALNDGLIGDIGAFIIMLPMVIYFQPLLTIIGVTALSNYYIYGVSKYNMTQIKICGIKTPEILDVTVSGGVRFIGFVFYPPSPRYIDIDTAKELALSLPTGVRAVGLFVDPTDEQLDDVIGRVPIDMLQLHGSESVERVAQIKDKYALPIIKAFPVSCAQDIEVARAYEDVIDWILFDNIEGGSGKSFDWSLLKGKEFSKPWILSGGLTPDNVGQALEILKPNVVDVSSGVESVRGIKCPDKIFAFIEACRSQVANNRS